MPTLAKRLDALEQSPAFKIESALHSGDFSKLTEQELNRAIAMIDESVTADLCAKGLTAEEIAVYKAGGFYFLLSAADKAEYEAIHDGPPQLSEHQTEVWRRLEARATDGALEPHY